jgi:carboxyl-terminal processing protease
VPIAVVLIAALTATAASPPAVQSIAVVTEAVPTRTTTTPLVAPPYEKEIAGIAAQMLEQFHYAQHPLDDEISSRWLDNYLRGLDPNRNVFLQSDLDEFDAWRTELDDAVSSRPPNIEPALAIYERYRQRMAERLARVRTVLAAPLDLENDETFVPDRDEAGLGWPATTEEANEWWRKQVEDIVIGEWLSSEDMATDGDADAEPPPTEAQIVAKLLKRYDRIQDDLDETESNDVLEMWLNALGQSFDPHSGWFKPATSDDFDIDITNSVEGIGAQLGTDEDHTVIKDIIDGGPADKSDKLEAKDKIVAVAQADGEFVDVVGLRLEKVVQLIRGPKGTEVRLKILPVGGAPGQTEVVSLVRERVIVEKATSKMFEVDGHKLGVVTLPNFYVEPDDLKTGLRAAAVTGKLLEELDAQGAEGVVLDLRENGGGALVEAIDVAGLFLPGGPVVQIRSRDGDIEALHDQDPGVAWAGPLVVLVDPTSASASEIVAGALQDYGRAVVVGSAQTHGKGTVQQLVDVDPHLRSRHPDGVGGKMKLTIQKFYRVSGGSTQGRGVASDVIVPSRYDGLDIYESDLDYSLPWDRIPSAPHVRTGDAVPALDALRAKSEARVTKNAEFQRLERTIAERHRLEAEREVSLDIDERRAQHAAILAAIGKSDEDGDKDAFILDEALHVLLDYTQAQKG